MEKESNSKYRNSSEKRKEEEKEWNEEVTRARLVREKKVNLYQIRLRLSKEFIVEM